MHFGEVGSPSLRQWELWSFYKRMRGLQSNDLNMVSHSGHMNMSPFTSRPLNKLFLSCGKEQKVSWYTFITLSSAMWNVEENRLKLFAWGGPLYLGGAAEALVVGWAVAAFIAAFTAMDTANWATLGDSYSTPWVTMATSTATTHALLCQ